jgi:RNA polymerase sigma factor (TIGR02999 family)
MSDSTPITALLAQARGGDSDAIDKLIPLIYSELHRLAEIVFRSEAPGNTLQPTALLHEAFLRLFADTTTPLFVDRAHFLGIAARLMRQILVDHARSRRAQKRGSGLRVQFSENLPSAKPDEDLLDLDRALADLAEEDPRLVVLIELRFFGGMTAKEIAEIRTESVHVVRHDLRYAQARLRRIFDRTALD